MPYSERSRCVRWRLGRLPGGQPKSCTKHPDRSLSKKYAIQCLDMRQNLQMPTTIEDSLPFLLNLLPTRFTFGGLLGYHSFCAALFMAIPLEIYF
ncbi:hypothetical protein G6F37_011185 [Rhizopus arrhizus]|nr:hypothetical protein G6F38_012177 [Rhizopus arrhizus]KAG1150500.1 hypothetical protein G6F37_011185 [Rhizopus arrhizus]